VIDRIQVLGFDVEEMGVHKTEYIEFPSEDSTLLAREGFHYCEEWKIDWWRLKLVVLS
jgi:hypothetical protein